MSAEVCLNYYEVNPVEEVECFLERVHSRLVRHAISISGTDGKIGRSTD